MRNKRITKLFLLLLILTLSALNAQTSLNVKNKSGSISSFGLKDINKLIFAGGNLTVIKKDANFSVFLLNDIGFINFGEFTAIEEISIPSTTIFTLFPNPVSDQLNIKFNSETNENTIIQIMDLQGRILYQQNQKCISGVNLIDIQLLNLSKGIYFCKIQKATTIENIKFIKN